MKVGKVEQYLLDKIDGGNAVLSVVIDPIDYPSPEAAIKAGVNAAEAGADMIAIGGSTSVQGELLDHVAKSIKQDISVPMILFPGNVGTITRHADAIYFLTLLNSRNPYWLGQAQMLGAPLIKQFGIESVPTAYIVVEPGGTVGWVGDAKLIPRNKPKIAAALALTGELAGNHIVFTDAGSASEQGPVPPEMVRAVSSVISVPYMVAGGIRKLDEARGIIRAGADMIQIGTVIENADDVQSVITSFRKTINDARASRGAR